MRLWSPLLEADGQMERVEACGEDARKQVCTSLESPVGERFLVDVCVCVSGDEEDENGDGLTGRG